MSTLTTSIQHCTGALVKAIRKEKNRYLDQKGSKTTSIHELPDILYGKFERIYKKNPFRMDGITEVTGNRNQETTTQMYFYILDMNNLNRKLRRQFHLQ